VKYRWLGLGLGGVGALALFLIWAERLLNPWMWTLGLGLGQLLAPNLRQTADVPSVDWDAVEREVAAADVPSEANGKEPPKGNNAKPKAPKQAGGALFVSAERVLALSKRAQVPASRYVPASGDRPAGLQVAGVGGLGIGVKDGDVLTKVAGADVRSSATVISTVLKLRAQKAKAVSGEFWRGQERWQIVFEMPYLEPPAASAPGLKAKPEPAPSSQPAAPPSPPSPAAGQPSLGAAKPSGTREPGGPGNVGGSAKQ
jgi:hypothetical protein